MKGFATCRSVALPLLWLILAAPLAAAVRITEVMYHPPQGDLYQYVEIHNDGASAVDIGGFSFTDGIGFTIPNGTSIAAGAYLVISASKSSFQAAYPGVSPALLLGDFGPASSLDNSGERITLVDKGGATVETFRYNDDTPWDFLADGFGASLERLCCSADPELPENWRAGPLPLNPTGFGGSPGAESAARLCPPVAPAIPRVFISEIMYHPVEENDLEDNHEFIEIHNAEGSAVSLAGWRIAGGTEYVFQPAASINAGEYLVIAKNPQRLAAVASYALNASRLLGPYTRSLDNGGEKVALIGPQNQGVDSVTYDDDFPWSEGADALGADEEWLPPALLPLSNHRYRGISLERVTFDLPGGVVYNWAPSPLDGATPQRPNASALPSPLPIVTDLSAVPATGTDPMIRRNIQVKVRARFGPSEPLSDVRIEYFADNVEATGEPTTTASMFDDGTNGDPVAGDDEHTAILPAQTTDNVVVRYRIRGNRGAGLETISPRPSDPRAWHAYFVAPVVNTTTRLYHVLISRNNWTAMWDNVQGGRVSGCTPRAGWDATVPAIFIHDGKVFDVFVRYQGSRYNRSNGPSINTWPYPAPARPSPLRALSWRIALPRYAQVDGRSVLTLNKLTQGCPGYDAGVGYRLYAAAGLPAPATRFARLHVNGGYYHYMIEYERPGEEMMRRWHRAREAADPTLPRERVGHLHKSAGCNCDEGPYGWGDERILTAQCGFSAHDRYKYTYDRKTHGWADYTNIQEMIEELNGLRSLGDYETLRVWFEERFDLELLLNYIAIMNWSVPFDDMFQNHFLYQRLSDGKWILMPWDLDLNFGGWKGATASLYMGEQGNPDNRSGWWNYWKDAFLKSYRPEFEARLLELNETVLHPTNVKALVDLVLSEANPTEAAQAPAGVACSFSGDASTFKNFADQRYQVVRQQLSAVQVDAGPDQTVFAGSLVQFDARNSRPDPGAGVTYTWSNGMTGEMPAFRFDTPGVYDITLTITVNGVPYRDTVRITVVAPPSEAFQESNGLVVFEAESFFLNDRHGSTVHWDEATARAGYSGAGYMIAAEDAGRVTFPANYATTSPEMRYAILFTNTGDYRVWIRALSDASDHDSCHVGLDGVARDESFAQRFAVGTSFAWAGVTRATGSPPQILSVATPGLHYLSIWVRESAQIVDKILLTKDTAAAAPSGAGPAESPKTPIVVREPFVRGDANKDGAIDLSDALAVLFHLFAAGGPKLDCEDHGDADDTGVLNVTDATYLLLYLYRAGSAPRAPFPSAGFDPTPDAYNCGNQP